MNRMESLKLPEPGKGFKSEIVDRPNSALIKKWNERVTPPSASIKEEEIFYSESSSKKKSEEHLKESSEESSESESGGL